MKRMLIIAMLLASTAAFAQQPAEPAPQGGEPRQEKSFEERKAQMLNRLEEKQKCLQSAADAEALGKCHGGKREGKGKGGHEVTAENFAERKAQILKRMEEHSAKLQKAQACVNAAATPETLKACRPEGGRGKGKHKGHGLGGPESEDGPPGEGRPE